MLADGESFVNWTQALREQVASKVVAIDGKSLRSACKSMETIVHLVSAWMATNRLVLGQIKVDNKSNKADAYYVLAIKGNHEAVHQEVKSFLDEAIIRKEPHLHHWEKLRSIEVIESVRQTGEQTPPNGVTSCAVCLPTPKISPRPCNLWVPDVSMQEDQSRARSQNAAENLTLLREAALNCLRQEPTQARKSVKGEASHRRSQQKLSAPNSQLRNLSAYALSASTPCIL